MTNFTEQKSLILNLEDKWEIIKNLKECETKGYSPDKTWFQLKSNPTKTALFKPDSSINNSDCELRASETAEKLGLKHAETEIVKYKDNKGTLSHNFKNPYKIYIPAERFIFNSIPTLYRANQAYDSSKEFYQWTSMDIIQQFTPEIEMQTVNMLVYDCLIQNRDRHGKNFEIEIDFTGESADIAPLFDHGMSFGWSKELEMFNPSDYSDEEWQAIQDEIISEETMDDSRITWQKGKPISHMDMFTHLSTEYPQQVGILLERSANIPDLDDFCKNRLDTMQELYIKNKYLKLGKNREIILAKQKPSYSPSRIFDIKSLTVDINPEINKYQDAPDFE